MPELVSKRAQVARLRRTAVRALADYPVDEPRLTFIAHGENTTFRVDSRDGRFLLRVHRPNRHGPGVDSRVAVGSELDWLAALQADTELSVPAPVRARSGEWTAVADGRVCSLLGWQYGRMQAAHPRPVHFRRLGGILARLHEHASGWDPPPGFVRMRWDWDTFFGNTMEYGGVPAAGCWDLLPAPVRPQFDEVARRMRGVMAELGSAPEVFGLIHADLHLENALFDGDAVRLIDFDDCGLGYWLYDLAVPLWEYRTHPEHAAIREALLAGYGQLRALPDLTYLDDFVATRDVAFGLWFAGMAQVNPAFAADLDRTMDYLRRSLDQALNTP
ncbi:aminoglycoside phosphotransferase [Kribbella sp. ALI-6-A]|uniref:phosphotransferase enzyme family protein n=1 Tax=Kribbella sp. ALI-6-A TaxID=1933817 RepID=UPI00097C6626|nr:phosphotransferase [Kribbella sp. ALI-6-A]ONI67274.1 aminoglycoside phosphotransferase [Kribbella sp. ALI-6-A]